MGKQGTVAATAASMKSKSASTHSGPSHKNVVHGGRSAAPPSSGGKTKPIKGSDRGGV